MVSTRSGRIVKKPVFYEPEEVVEDDFSDSDYDSDDTGGSDCESIRTEGEEDDNGSDLEDFIVDDDDEESMRECDDEEEEDYSGTETETSDTEPELEDDE